MKRVMIISTSLLIGLKTFAQVTEKDTIYILIDKSDTLIEKKVLEISADIYNAVYYLYDEALIEETKRMLKESPILPQGACDYYYFSTYDTGKVVNEIYLDDKIVYSRKDLIEKGVYTSNFYAIEQETDRFRIRKLYFSACE